MAYVGTRVVSSYATLFIHNTSLEDAWFQSRTFKTAIHFYSSGNGFNRNLHVVFYVGFRFFVKTNTDNQLVKN